MYSQSFRFSEKIKRIGYVFNEESFIAVNEKETVLLKLDKTGILYDKDNNYIGEILNYENVFYSNEDVIFKKKEGGTIELSWDNDEPFVRSLVFRKRHLIVCKLMSLICDC